MVGQWTASRFNRRRWAPQPLRATITRAGEYRSGERHPLLIVASILHHDVVESRLGTKRFDDVARKTADAEGSEQSRRCDDLQQGSMRQCILLP